MNIDYFKITYQLIIRNLEIGRNNKKIIWELPFSDFLVYFIQVIYLYVCVVTHT